MPKPLNEQQIREIIALGKTGLKNYEIAEALNLSTSAVGYHLLRNGLRKNAPSKRRMGNDDEERQWNNTYNRHSGVPDIWV